MFNPKTLKLAFLILFVILVILFIWPGLLSLVPVAAMMLITLALLAGFAFADNDRILGWGALITIIIVVAFYLIPGIQVLLPLLGGV